MRPFFVDHRLELVALPHRRFADGTLALRRDDEQSWGLGSGSSHAAITRQSKQTHTASKDALNPKLCTIDVHF